MKDYYEEPSWLKGSIYEVLQDRGNYTLFLQAVDRCDYTAILSGRSILTVMAPDDASMRSYLTENYGTESVDDVPLDELKKLIGFHLLYYSFDKDKLSNFRPAEGDGASEEEKEVYAGLYHKFRTHSQDAPTQVQPDRVLLSETNVIKDTTGVTVDVYHLERYLPIFSHYMFETKLIDAARNYNYFFPETPWMGDEGFNVANAAVTEYAIPAKNGYLYLVDRVLRPLETIHTELEQNEQYSQYLKLYDKYDYYAIDDDLTNTYGGGTKTYYQRLYESTSGLSLVNIASEWPVSNYLQVTALSSISYSVFAPTNEAFDEFYRSYWGDEGTGYPTEVSYDSVSADAINYLISNSICSNFGSNNTMNYLAFPEEIENGKVSNAITKTPITFDVDAVPQANRRLCSNGVLYGQSILTPPAVFGSVTGPAYKYKKYSTFLKMFTASKLDETLSDESVQFLMLYPSNAQFEANNIWYDEATDKIKNGVPGSTNSSNLGSSAQMAFVNAHVVSLQNGWEELPMNSATPKVYRTMSSDKKFYWYVKNGKITNSYKYNSLIHYAGNMDVTADSIYAPLRELTFRGSAWSNGHCYEYDADAQKFLLEGSNDNAIYAKFVPMMYAHRNDDGTLFQGFIQLLMLAEMIDEQAQSMNYMTENCMMLVPTTEAVKSAILAGTMPYVQTAATSADDPSFWSLCSIKDGTNLEDFQHYMLEYFLPESTAPCGNYPYPGWGEDIERDGGIPSIADISVTPAASATIYIKDEGNRMTAWVSGGQKVNFHAEYEYLPFVFDDGCVQFIDGVFEDAWPGRQNVALRRR
jgi:uncharacterized surface protein with fasciclin (FAS1) repeats